MSTDRIKLIYKPTTEYARDRMGPVTLTIPHGDVWVHLVDDFVAFLRLTGYHIDEPWAEDYADHKRIADKASRILSELQYDEETGSIRWPESGTTTGEDAVELAADNGRNSTPSRRGKRTDSKKKKKKA